MIIIIPWLQASLWQQCGGWTEEDKITVEDVDSWQWLWKKEGREKRYSGREPQGLLRDKVERRVWIPTWVPGCGTIRW